MKALSLFLVTLLSSGIAFAEAGELASIECSQDNFKVVLQFSTIGGKGTGEVKIPVYSVFKDDQMLSPMINNIRLEAAGYDSDFLNSYVWAFQSESSVLAVAVPGLEELTPGVYSDAKADLFLEVGDEVMSGSTVDCIVTIK